MMLLLGKFIIRPDVTLLSGTTDVYGHLRNNKMTKQQKIAFELLILFIVILVLPSFLPATNPIGAFCKRLDIMGVTALCLILVAVLTSEGKPLDNINACVKAGVGWDLIFMIAASMPIAAAIEQEEAGIIATVLELVMPVVYAMGPVALFMMVVLAFGLITQFVHNVVLMIIFTPVICGICVEIGVSPDIFLVLMTLTCGAAYLTPGASGAGAMMHGNTAWISTKALYTLSAICLILTWIVYIGLVIPAGMMLT